MRSNNLFMLAGLAGYVLARPTDLTVGGAHIDIDKRDLVHSIGADVNAVKADVSALDLTAIIGDVLGGVLGSSQCPATLFVGLSAQAAAALQGAALGLKAGVVLSAARAELALWLQVHAGVSIDASVKASLLEWCHGDDSAILSVDVSAALSLFTPVCADIAAKGNLYVTLDGILSTVDLAANVVLSVSAQASLSAFLSASVDVSLDAHVKAGLHLCAAGGLIADLSVDVKAALHAYLSSSDCALSVSLKASVQAWLEGKVDVDVIAIGDLPATGLTTVSVGASISALVDESGLLSASAQASLLAFLKAHVAVDIEADIKTALQACAAGHAAVVLSAEIRAALVAWITSSSCSLGAELKAVVLLWLSFAVTADVTASASVGVSTGLIGHLTADVTASIGAVFGDLLHGALSIITVGESVVSLSLEARAKLAVILAGAACVDIDVDIHLILIEWLTGCSTTPGTPPTGTVPAVTPINPGGPLITPPAVFTPTVPQVVTVTTTVTVAHCK